jgi:hypothetical protein
MGTTVAPCYSPKTCHVSRTHSSNFLPRCHATIPTTCCTTLPHHPYGCATCHPCSGDMWHTLIGPPVQHIIILIHPVITLSTLSHCTYHCTFPCQLYGRTSSTVIFHVITVRTVHTIQSSSIFFLFGNTTVCLSPFKLCWVRNVEAYAPFHFEDIMITFIFRPF